MKSKFTGSTFGLMGIYIVAMLLTICTASIGASWAICMVLRWTISHTEIDGKRLKFDGKGGRLLGMTILWMVPSLLIAGLTYYTMVYVQDIQMAWLLAIAICLLAVIYIFWIAIREQKWITKHIHFEANEPAVEKSELMNDMD